MAGINSYDIILNLSMSKVKPESSAPEKPSNGSFEKYRFLIDERTPTQIYQQCRVAEDIYKNNLTALGIQMTTKKKIVYEPSPLIKVQLPNEWYAMVTDSGKEEEVTVLTLHGAPGDHREWAGLQKEMNGYCRWINFIIPGFDGLDERRGNYSGSAQDLSKLITMVLTKLKVAQVVLVAHSMGSIFAGYLFDAYPQYFRGYINVTGIVNYWYVGLKTFYRNVIGCYGFGVGPNRNAMLRLLNKDEYRAKQNARFIDDTREIFFGTKVQFPALSVTEMSAYIKLLSSLPEGLSQTFELNHRIKMLRVLIFGKKDPLHTEDLVSEQIYSICRGRFKYSQIPKNRKVLAAAKEELERTLYAEFGVKIEAEKIQDYFCYNFDDTGHNAHKRRPIEMSRILRIYLVTIRVLEKYENLTRSSL